MNARSIAFFASHAAGGIRELWADLGTAFAARGDSVQLVALYPYEPEAHDPGDGLRWTYMVPERPRGFGGKARMLRNLAAWLQRERPDVIVTAMPAVNVLLPLFARLCSPDTVLLTSHHSPVETHNPVLNALDSQVGRLGNVRSIVSVSDAVRMSLHRKPSSYRAKSLTIHNALPRRISEHLARLVPQREGRTIGRNLVAAGRLSEQKNYPMLVRAAQYMPDVIVQILGSGPDEAVLKEMASGLGVGARVHFLGHRDREEALRLLSVGDIFVQVSLFEGHSLALLEAASLGLPLIVSDVPSQREAVTSRDGTQCGIIVALDDAVGLARAASDLLGNPAAYALWAARALALAKEATFDAMVADYEALIVAT